MMSIKNVALASALTWMAATFCLASDWPQWRGPFFNGSTDERGLPASWSKTENVAWVTEVPGAGGGSPVVWEDSVFLAAQDALGISRGTIRATVLIETILAAFEMDEILWELREHSVGLNCGRWDYLFSFIKSHVLSASYVYDCTSCTVIFYIKQWIA
jgi:hypothetical protein